MGQEFYDLGVHIALAPVTGGPLGRAPRNGRNWEGRHQSDFEAQFIAPNLPPLCDRLVRGSLCNRRGELPECQGPARRRSPGYIQVRDSTATTRDLLSRTFPRHFIAYEQETSRNVYINKTLGGLSGLASTLQLPISSNLDDKTTHETYLWSFAEAVRAGTSSVMSSYNIINGTHGSANSDALNGLLKTELNFQGFVVSDWGGKWQTRAIYTGGKSDIASFVRCLGDSRGCLRRQ